MGSSLGELFKKRKVIYPREPTDADELYKEMLRNNRELGNMLVGKPRMFTPKVALLTFYPLAPVPQEISAFGGMLRVKEYEEREKQGGGGRGRGIGRGRGRGRGGEEEEERQHKVEAATSRPQELIRDSRARE